MTHKLLDGHPTLAKLQQLFELAEKLGILIDYTHSNCMVYVTDTKLNLQFELKDIDDNRPVRQFPPHSEYKLTFEKEDSEGRTLKKRGLK